MLREVFLNTICEYKMVKKKDKLLLGVSGGPDSIALLRLFAEMRKEYKLNLVALHLNHCLRKESGDEEKFVKAVCEKLDVKLVSQQRDVTKVFQGDSLEQCARQVRFDFFLTCARQLKIKKCALAHHRDDLVETTVMRFIRGAGLRGLRGFLPVTKWKSITFIRPLISLRKCELLDWLDKNKFEYCVDQSNFDEKFLRNKIRHNLIPQLENLNGNFVENVANLAESLALDYEYIYQQSFIVYQKVRHSQTQRTVTLDLAKIKELPVALFNNVIRFSIEQLKGNLRRIEAKHLKEIRDLVLNRPVHSVVDLPLLSVKKEKKLLVLESLLL